MTETYTFEFTILEPGSEPRSYRRRVDKADLLKRFDEALEWASESFQNYAYVSGPRMSKCTVDQSSRRHLITKVLQDARDLDPNKPTVIGLFWADLDEGAQEAHMTMWKIVRTVEQFEGFELPHLTFTLKRVKEEDEKTAATWARSRGWQDWGTWYRDRPAIVLAPDWHQADAAISQCYGIAKHLTAGHLIRSSCRFSLKARPGRAPYKYIRSTRQRQDIQRMRSQYPTASENMEYVPLEILIQKYGYSLTVEERLVAREKAIDEKEAGNG